MTGNDSLQCGCEGTRHRVCVELSPVLRDPWREAAPWLADYDAGLGGRGWRRGWEQRPNTPNHKVRRAAAVKLGVALRLASVAPGATDCGCRGRRHLVCLKAPKWNALVKAIYPTEPENNCDGCERYSRHVQVLRHKRHEHGRACRVRSLAQRYGDSQRERVQTRIRRLWLGVLREAWV
jgi:hypothetical protein